MTAQTELNRSVAHGVFTIERPHPSVTPQRVFDAFASVEGKNGWFTAPNDRWDIVERTMDFRVGGRERLKGRWRTGMVTEFVATYFDIIPASGSSTPTRCTWTGGRSRSRSPPSSSALGHWRQADHDGTGRLPRRPR